MLREKSPAEGAKPFVENRIFIIRAKRLLCQPEDLCRSEAETEHIIKIKVMQLIRSYEVFRFLRDHSVHRRQQFRADRGIQHVKQYLPQFLLPGSIRIVTHQMTHQRLRHRSVYRIHGHVIAVVGGPAQRQLRHIAGPDDHAVLLIGNVHEDLCPLSRLRILIGDIMDIGIMADICKMLFHRPVDADFPQRRPQLMRERHRVGICPVRGSKTWHGHTGDALPRQPQHIKSSRCHQHCQCGIQTAADADDSVAAVRMCQSLFQSHGLNREDLVTPFIPVFLTFRNERRPGIIPVQLRLRLFQCKIYFIILLSYFIRHKGGRLLPVCRQTLQIDLRFRIMIFKPFGLCQHRSVFRDHIVAAVYQILRGFSFSRRCVNICADQSCGLGADQLPAIRIFCGRLIAGRRIADDGRPGQCVKGRRRQRHPQIFADLTGQHEVLDIFTTEKEIHAKRNFLPQQMDHLHLPFSRRKMSRLIKLRIVRQVTLRHHP